MLLRPLSAGPAHQLGPTLSPRHRQYLPAPNAVGQDRGRTRPCVGAAPPSASGPAGSNSSTTRWATNSAPARRRPSGWSPSTPTSPTSRAGQSRRYPASSTPSRSLGATRPRPIRDQSHKTPDGGRRAHHGAGRPIGRNFRGIQPVKRISNRWHHSSRPSRGTASVTTSSIACSRCWAVQG